MKMTTLVIQGTLSTSNKVSAKNRQKNPAKTAYINADDANLKKAQEFGMNVYGDVDRKTGEFGEGEKWLIVPTAEKVTVLSKGKVIKTISGLAQDDTPTFQSEDKIMNLAITHIDPENGDNAFYRLKSINGHFVFNEIVDPFDGLEDLSTDVESKDEPVLNITSEDLPF